MIVIFKNDEIYAVDKKLLQDLNTNLENLNTILSSIKLSLSYLENQKINIQNKYFNVVQIDILSIDNLKVFDLTEEISSKEEIIPIEEHPLNEEFSLEIKEPEIQPKPETIFPEISLSQTTQQNLEESLSKETSQVEISLPNNTLQSETLPEISLSEETLQPEISFSNNTPQSETLPEISLSENTSQPEISISETIPEFNTNLEGLQNQQPQQENIQPIEEGVIKISFENDYDEISNILSLNKEEIQKLIQEDLEKASKDLGVDLDLLNDLIKDLLKQINENKNAFYEAINNYDYEKLHKLAHSLKGAALNLRLSNIALILKYIDEKSKAKENIENIKYLIDKFYNFIENIQSSNINTNNVNLKITPEIKNLIINTIKNYTATQNTKKLKKDLKYIEKILGIKIDSIEELQNIIKGI